MSTVQFSLDYISSLLCCRNSVTGWGKIQNRRVFVTADDFSVRGGHADGGIAMKAPHGEVGKKKIPVITFSIHLKLTFIHKDTSKKSPRAFGKLNPYPSAPHIYTHME